MFWFLAAVVFGMFMLSEWLWTYRGRRGWAIGTWTFTCVLWVWMMTYADVTLTIQ